MKKNYKKNTSLLARIWASIIVTSLIPLVLVNYIWFHNTSQIVYENEMQSASNLLYQLNMRIENMFNSININSYAFLFDTKVREIVSTWPANEAEREKNEAYIRNIFKQMKKSNTMICSVEFTGSFYQISSEESEYSQVDFDELKGYEWYQEFSDYHVDSFTPVYYNRYIEKYNTPVIGWIRKISSVESGQTVGSFLIEISYSDLAYMMREAQEQNNHQMLIFDKKGNIIFQPSDEIRFQKTEQEKKLFEELRGEKNEFTFAYEDRNYACICDKLSTTKWYLAMLIDKQDLMAYGVESVKQSMVLVIFIVVFSFAIAYGMSRHIIKPINQLAETMKLVENNQLNVSVPASSNVMEVAILSRGFNNMLSHIRKLLDEVRKEEQEKKNLEIQMLQAQINPHFLYNTLNVIRWEAVMHGETTISKMIISLIKLLEFSGKRTDTYVPIEKELDHAVSYLELIRYQYKDDFEVVYDIDQEALSCYTVKFILQPLVENAVFHGLEPLGEKGQVRIIIRREEENIYFCVEDNGVGMPEEAHKGKSAFRGLGIYNVNERLKRHYGEQSYLKIESEENKGTKISFRIPIVQDGFDGERGLKDAESSFGG